MSQILESIAPVTIAELRTAYETALLDARLAGQSYHAEANSLTRNSRLLDKLKYVWDRADARRAAAGSALQTAIEKNIRILERRAGHLEIRIANSDKELSYDIAERNALAWASDELRRIYNADNN